MTMNNNNLGILRHTMNPSQAQELVQSLPCQPGWGTKLCPYQGFWYNPTDLVERLHNQNEFQARDTDVVLATSPKAGTTWLKSLLFAITKRSQYAADDPNHPLLSTNPHNLIPFLEGIGNLSSSWDDDIASPRLLSTHNPYNMLPASVKTTKSRIIYLCRDPRDVFVSYWLFSNMIMVAGDGSKCYIPLEEAFELLRKGITNLGPIWDHALEYWNVSLKEPEKVLFLKYEDLKSDIVSQVKKMAEFVGFPFSAEEESRGIIQEIAKMCSFDNLSNLDVNKSGIFSTKSIDNGSVSHVINNKDFFRKGQVGDWKNIFAPSMCEQFDKVTKQKLPWVRFEV